MPATNAASEHSFSALRRCKNLAANQCRLTNVMTLNIHKEIYMKLDLVDTFVEGSEHT